MTADLPEIVAHFRFEGDLTDGLPYGFGHINDTYAVGFRQADGSYRRYILQRINQQVFRDPDAIMENMVQVTRHLRTRIISDGGDPERETLNLVPTVCDNSHYVTPGNDYWRAFQFIEGARSYEQVENPRHVTCAARAFGTFQSLLSDFPVAQLHETIPDFHNTPKRYEAFSEAVSLDPGNRAVSVQREIEFVRRRQEEMPVLVDLLEAGSLPARVTHNDTKFNNVMIDDLTGEAVCVIDLDTVMPGLALYDFGDAVRSAANTAAEDEPDLSRVAFDLAIYERIVEGFLDTAGDFLIPLEIEYLPFAARLLTLECGMRFLADYLLGDVYFKVQHPEQNLDRCRTQFKMIQGMEANADLMIDLVAAYDGRLPIIP
ncbi:MAG: aminoglycoside phosphotransferase family protein [Chloroflexota bacterium]|nr:aminoglycoside phosphotransferase family protein [Chloroflexota bacterium]